MRSCWWKKLVLPFVLVALTACGDSGDDDSRSSVAGAKDFAGVWDGNGKFTAAVDPNDPDNGTFPLEVVLNEDAGIVFGSFSDDNISGSVSAGVYKFKVTSNSSHPDCTDFNVSGEGNLSDDNNKMTLKASGSFCGKQADIAAVLTRIAAVPPE